MKVYRQVLAAPGALGVLILGLLARIPFSTLGLLLTLHCVFGLGRSYLEAGLIVTASTLGTAISSPWRGRLVDRHGLRRALVPSLIIEPLALVGAAFAGYELLVALAFLGGLFSIPVWTIVRTSLSVVVPATLRRSAFSLDAVFTEVVFMAGPAAATIVAMRIGTQETLLIVAALVVAAGVGLMIVNPPTRSAQVMLPTRLPAPLEASENAALAQKKVILEAKVAEDLTTGQIPVITEEMLTGRAPSARGALLTAGGLTLLLATAVGNGTIMATDMSIVAILENAGKGAAIAVAMSVWCFGSLVGGFAYGAASRTIGPLWVLLGLGVLTVPVAFASTLPLLLVAVFLAGLGLAPLITSTGEAISQRVPEEVRGEAMGWHGSAMTVGAAIGSPLFGAVIDARGATWGVALAAIAAIVVAITGLVARQIRRQRRLRELRLRFA